MHQTTHQPMRRTGRPIATTVTILALTLGLAVSTTGRAVADEFNHITGTPGNDRLRGTADADDIRGERGDDRLWGYVGPDVLSGGPATAAQERFTDANDRKGFDIRVVKVRYGDRVNIRVAHDGKVATGQQYKFWFDTKSENAGPEYSFVFAPNSDSFRFRKVNSFSDSGSAVTNCGQSWGGTANIFQPRRDVLAFVGAQCLGAPPRIRVSAQAMVSGPDDWAPGFHKFYGKVARY